MISFGGRAGESAGKQANACLRSRKPWVLSQERAGWGRKEKDLGVIKEPGGIEREQYRSQVETKLVRTKGNEHLSLRPRTGMLALGSTHDSVGVNFTTTVAHALIRQHGPQKETKRLASLAPGSGIWPQGRMLDFSVHRPVSSVTWQVKSLHRSPVLLVSPPIKCS